MNRTETNSWALLLTAPTFVYCLFIFTQIIKIPLLPHLAKAGPIQFLTNWALAFSLLSLGVSCLTYITRLKFLWKIKHEVHPVALVICSVVTFVYWPLRIFMLDRMVVRVDEFLVPIFFDLLLHLLPTFVLALEYFLFMPAWRLTWVGAMGWSISLTYAYWWVLHRVIDKELGATFPYVFLDVPTPERAIVFSVIGFAAWILFLLFGRFHRTLIKPVVVKAKQS